MTFWCARRCCTKKVQFIAQYAIHCVSFTLLLACACLLFVSIINLSSVHSDLHVFVRISHIICAIVSPFVALVGSAGELKQNHLLLTLSASMFAYLMMMGGCSVVTGWNMMDHPSDRAEPSLENAFKLYEMLDQIQRRQVNPLSFMHRYKCCGFNNAHSLAKTVGPPIINITLTNVLPNACCDFDDFSHIFHDLTSRNGFCQLFSNHRHFKSCDQVARNLYLQDQNMMNLLGALVTALNAANCYFSFVLSKCVRDVDF